MGTNYYWHEGENSPCKLCGKSNGRTLHIGKSSFGWVFNLHLYKDAGPRDLVDWLRAIRSPGSTITNEYGDVITADEMLGIFFKLGNLDKPPPPDCGPDSYWSVKLHLRRRKGSDRYPVKSMEFLDGEYAPPTETGW